MIPIASFYLGANSVTPATSGFNRPQSMSQASLPHSPTSPPPNSGNRANPASYRSSMPPPSRAPAPGTPPASSFVNQPSSANEFKPRQFEPTPEEADEDPNTHTVRLERAATSPTTDAASSAPTPQNVQNMKAENRKSRNGSMNKEFKFPPTSPVSPNPAPTAAAGAVPLSSSLDDAEPLKKSPPVPSRMDSLDSNGEAPGRRGSVITPSNIEVPAPPPVEKEKSMSKVSIDDSGEDDVGDTVDIPLN